MRSSLIALIKNMNPILSLVAFLGVLSLVNGDACSDSLAQNNNYRSQHGSPPMKCNNAISQDAQAYADQLGQNCDFQHSGDERYGENLYMSGTSGSPPSASTAAKAAVDSWYSEEQCYDYNDPQFQSCRSTCRQADGQCKMDVGHFTQLVWKGTTEVGVGVVNCEKNGWLWTIVVANYKPPGNYEGQFAENVQGKS